jgi:hypothetical protein
MLASWTLFVPSDAWKTILLGACGSALFWVILELSKRFLPFLGKRIGGVTSRVIGQLQRENEIREWIYRKYTSRDGLIPLVKGQLISFDAVFRESLRGLVVLCIAFILREVSPILFSILLVGAITLFLSAMRWLKPPRWWREGSAIENWERVANLEMSFFGDVDEDTKTTIANLKREVEVAEIRQQ